MNEFLDTYRIQGQMYGSALNVEGIDHDRYSVNSQKFDNTPLSPCGSHHRLPWEAKCLMTNSRPSNARPKRRKFVVMKKSKLKALSIIFTVLALLVLSFQVRIVSFLRKDTFILRVLKATDS